jgi:MFS family permease
LSESSKPNAPRHDPLDAFRQPNFLLYSLNRVGSALGQSMFQAVLAWQVYDITGSVASLGLLGLVRFLPSLSMALVGGAVADSYDRRLVMAFSKVVPFIGASILATATFGDWISLELILVLSVLTGIALSFENPARIALLPAIVKPESFENAVTVSNTMQKLAQMTGPTLGGSIIALSGSGMAYVAFCITLVVSLVPLLMLKYPRRAEERRGVNIDAIKEGVRFVFQRQVLLGAMALDLFATIFAAAQALLPVFASDILHVGPTGYGVLSSAMQMGAFGISAIMLVRPPVKETGKALIYTVVAFGLLTIAFGFTRDYTLAVVLYALIGAADQISVVMRQTTIQMSTPNEIRGRVSAVSQVFTGSSGQIGGARAGFVAALGGTTFAIVSGGVGAVIVALLIAWKMPQLFNFEIDRSAPAAVPRNEPVAASTVPSAEPRSEGAVTAQRS